MGPPVFGCAGKTDFSIVVSSSRRPRRVNVVRCVIDRSPFEPFLCSCLAAVSFVPACARRRAARKGPSRLAVAQLSPRVSSSEGHALTAASTARGWKRGTLKSRNRQLIVILAWAVNKRAGKTALPCIRSGKIRSSRRPQYPNPSCTGVRRQGPVRDGTHLRNR